MHSRKPNRDKEAQLSNDRLRELLRYDPKSGEFIWLKSTSNRAPTGSRAGCFNDDKKGRRYVLLGIDGVVFFAHRVAWFYVTGAWPDEIDHVDGDGWNNRLSNLRPAEHRENMFNTKRRVDNKTGVKGVCFYPSQDKYQAWLNHKYLGSFDTVAEAEAARTPRAQASHGQFYREM